jgi:hypothetical protein
LKFATILEGIRTNARDCVGEVYFFEAVAVDEATLPDFGYSVIELNAFQTITALKAITANGSD